MDEEKWADARSLLDQMSSQSIQPVLIDFGGLAYYSCSFPIKEITVEKPEKYCEVETLERDLNAVMSEDRRKTISFFKKWKSRTKIKRLSRYQEYFNKWLRMFTYRVEKRKRDANQLKNIIAEWRLIVAESKIIKSKARIAQKRCFKIWKRCHKNNDITTSVIKLSNYYLKKSLFKKWKLKKSRKQNSNKRNAVIKFRNDMLVQTSFDTIVEKYLEKTKPLRTEYFKKKQMFDTWKRVFSRSQEFSAKELKVSMEDDIMTSRKFLLLWRRKMKIARKKRVRRTVRNWECFTTHLLDFYKCKFVAAKACERRVFSIMKDTIGRKNMMIKSAVFCAWLQCVDVTRRKKAVQVNTKRWLMYRMLGKWQITFRAVNDIRLMNAVRQTVVNVHLKQTFFYDWLQKATDTITEKNKAALQLRKMQLKRKVFMEWHAYSELINIRAEEHYRKTVLSGAFAIFVQGTIGNKRENEAKAIAFSERKLKQKYMRKFKYLVPEPTDIDLTQMITLFNSGDIRYTLM